MNIARFTIPCSIFAVCFAIGCSGAASDPITEEPAAAGNGPTETSESAPPVAPTPPANGNEESIASTTRAVTKSVGAAVGFAAPISAAGETTPAEEPAKSGSQTVGEDPNGFVQDKSCVTSTWGPDLRLTITFKNCKLALTGKPVNGSVTLAASLAPVGAAVLFNDLVIDDDSLKGAMGIAFYGQPVQTRIAAALELSIDSGSTIAKVSALDIVSNANGALASGALSIKTPATSAQAAFSDLRWEKGLCHPVDGWVGWMGADKLPVKVTFLATTSQDGFVMAKLGALPEVKVKALDPCK